MSSPMYFVDFTYLQVNRLSDWHVALVELPHRPGFAFYLFLAHRILRHQNIAT